MVSTPDPEVLPGADGSSSPQTQRRLQEWTPRRGRCLTQSFDTARDLALRARASRTRSRRHRSRTYVRSSSSAFFHLSADQSSAANQTGIDLDRVTSIYMVF